MKGYRIVSTEAYFAEPQFSGNVGAIMISAQFAEKRTKHDPEARYTARLALYRRLYEEGFSEKQVVSNHVQIDLMLPLPQPLMIRFRKEILAMEKDKNMRYLDSLSRMCHEEGVQEGSLTQARESVIEALEIRFGEISTELRERINALDRLRALKIEHRRAITVPSLDQF